MFIVVDLHGPDFQSGTVTHVCLEIEAARAGLQELEEEYHYQFMDIPATQEVDPVEGFKIYELTMVLYSCKVGDEVCVGGLTEVK